MEVDLVVSMFESVQRQIEKVCIRLDQATETIMRNELTATERHTLLNTEIRDLNTTVRIQNGSVAEMRQWKAQHQSTHDGDDLALTVALANHAGRKAAVQEPVEKIMKLFDFLDKGFAKAILWILLLGGGAILGRLF